MKTLHKKDEYLRIAEDKVDEKLKLGFRFVPKQDWKHNVRDKPVIIVANTTDDKQNAPIVVKKKKYQKTKKS